MQGDTNDYILKEIIKIEILPCILIYLVIIYSVIAMCMFIKADIVL